MKYNNRNQVSLAFTMQYNLPSLNGAKKSSLMINPFCCFKKRNVNTNPFAMPVIIEKKKPKYKLFVNFFYFSLTLFIIICAVIYFSLTY